MGIELEPGRAARRPLLYPEKKRKGARGVASRKEEDAPLETRRGTEIDRRGKEHDKARLS
jgi:hypothetical protein